jgi:hypothetical protein
MAILMRLEVPGGTIEQYEKVNEALHIEGDEDAPDGLIIHMAADMPEGFLVIDVWESKELLDTFFETLGPALHEVGMGDAEPEFFEVHRTIPRGAGTDANVIMETRASIDTDEYDRMVSEIPAHAGDGSDHPVYVHVAAIAEDGSMYIADLWESPEAFGAFAQSDLKPVAEEGMEIDPKFHKVHNVTHGAKTKRTAAA